MKLEVMKLLIVNRIKKVIKMIMCRLLIMRMIIIGLGSMAKVYFDHLCFYYLR